MLQKEDLGFLDLLHDKARIVVMSRDLSPEEIKTYEEQVELKFLPSKFAADAVVLLFPKILRKKAFPWKKLKRGCSLRTKIYIRRDKFQ